MSSNANLPLLKEAFQPLMTIRDSVAHLFELLEAKTVQLKQCYGEYIRQSSNDSLVFGLDSFHFQGKLIDLEFQDMRRMFMAIDNRMYGEYYKLRKWMRQSCESLVAAHPTAAANNHNHNNHHISTASTASTAAMRRAVVFKDELEGEVEVYRDLEPYRVYCVEHLLRLHDDILRVLQWMNELIEEKELQLRHHQEKEHVGLNINNFVHSFRFEITIIREKQRLFVSFLEFFHTLHVKYLERVAAKVELMYEQLNHDIQWDPHVGHPALRTTIAAGTSGTATATTITNTTHTHPSFVPMKPSARILPTNLTTTAAAAASIPSNLASSTRSSPSPSSQPEDKQEPIMVQEKEKKTARWKTTMQKMKQAVAQSTVSRSASSESLAHPSIESFARAPPTSPAASMSSVTTSTSLASPSPSPASPSPASPSPASTSPASTSPASTSPASTSPASTSSPSSTKADTSSVAAAATDTPAFCASDWIARRMRASRDDSVEDVKVGMMVEMAENRNEESWKDEGKSTGEQAADLSFQDIYVQSA